MSEYLPFDPNSPVTLEESSYKIDDNTFDIHIRLTIEPPWYVFSQDSDPEGPEPTLLKFRFNSNIKLIDRVKEIGTLIEEFDEHLAVQLRYYKDSVVFVQRVKLKNKAPQDPFGRNVLGSVCYMPSSGKASTFITEEDFEVWLK